MPALLLIAALTAGATATVGTASHPANVVISQVYGGGGESNSTWNSDFVELSNRGGDPVDLSDWSIQYAPATGDKWVLTRLSGILPVGANYLVSGASGGSAAKLPTPDLDSALALGTTGGKVALVHAVTPLKCVTGCPTAKNVRDFVGYGDADDAEGRPAPALSVTTAALRRDVRAVDANEPPGTGGPDTGYTDPGGPAGVQAAGGADGSPPVGGLDTDNNGVDFVSTTPAPSSGIVSQTTRKVRITQIQGRSHTSPLAGSQVSDVPGLVTAVSRTGFWMQDPSPDNDSATSDGLFVYTGTAPKAQSGDSVRVSGTVTEYRPGGTAGTGNLSTTELTRPRVESVSGAARRPVPVRIGPGGRLAPTRVRTDAPGDVETSDVFAPKVNALDFYESLEGMLVRVVNPVVIAPSDASGQLAVLPAGDNAARTARGGLRPSTNGTFDPHRLLLDDQLAPLPTADVGDTLPGPVDGVLDYADGDYRIVVLATPEVTGGGTRPETAKAIGDTELTTASVDAGSTEFMAQDSPLLQVASTVVLTLHSPDIIAVGNVADDSGPASDGTVTADRGWTALLRAIVATGGPRYEYRQINPIDQADGSGGANRRTGFLYNPARVRFVDRSAGGRPATTATDVAGPPVTTGPVNAAFRPADLTQSPGRIAPNDPAFSGAPKSLAGEFQFRSHTVFVVANQFTTAGADDPYLGRRQPPRHPSEQRRGSQATALRGFLDNLLGVDPQANVVLLGGLADTETSPALAMLTAGGTFVDLTAALPVADRYSFLAEGEPQLLDHVLVSRALATGSTADVVHAQSEFAGSWSDHDPVVGALRLSH